MKGTVRLPLVVLILVVVIGVVGLGMLYLGKVSEVKELQQQLALKKSEVAQLDQRNKDLLKQLDGLQAERKSLDERVKSLNGQLSTMIVDLEKSRASLKDAESRYEQLTQDFQQEKTRLSDRLNAVTSERDDAKKRVQRLEDDKADLARSANRWRERLALLDRDYKQLAQKLEEAKETATHPGVDIVTSVGPAPAATPPASSSPHSPPQISSIPGTVELPPIVVRKDQTGMVATVRGRVLDVNTAHNFIVVDKGSMDGVRVGMSFDLLRGATPAGRATVVRVRPQIAACDIMRAKTPSPPQVGDVAVQSSP